MKSFLALLLITTVCFGQDVAAPKKLTITNRYRTYLAAVKSNPDNELVEIKKAIPTIVLDIRYATKNNFMQQVMYKQAKAFARKPVVAKLKAIQAELKKKGLGLKIYDAYRPYAITVAFYKKAIDKNFVANPNKGSRHNRGCAVDLTLVDLKTGREIEMSTPFDSFAPEAAADYEQLTPSIKKNRNLLIATMEANGFKVIRNEWWHFDFVGWENYDLMDIPFGKL